MQYGVHSNYARTVSTAELRDAHCISEKRVAQFRRAVRQGIKLQILKYR